ncbi:MAG: GHKL domain-containing protein [Desulfobacterales bacterium]|nr:GHKL domain-containing protein [Desulfobacterales bacterium]
MDYSNVKLENDFFQKLKWLTFFRVLFTSLLLGSTIVLQLKSEPSPQSPSLLLLYGLIIGIFLLSFIYSLILLRVRNGILFAGIQIIFDTFIVTFIIVLTGGFSSIFSFLYLLVIVYSSTLLFRWGSFATAAFCSIQYGTVVTLEYVGILNPYVISDKLTAFSLDWTYVSYKSLIVVVAGFAVAFLSGLLSEQVRKTNRALSAMEARVKRVEKLAAIGEMAAGLAHEVKNPLASLSGSIQMLKEEVRYNPDQDKLMQIALREADRLSALVNNFLLFASPPSAKGIPLELGEIIEETITIFKRDKNCCGSIDFSSDSVNGIWIEMDPTHLRQILWNLLLNAAEALSDNGKIEINIYNSKQKAIVKIKDNGDGIDKNTLLSIFDPFFTTKPRGTGLGLSIVHSIVESYGSWLDVESEVGRGTTFTLTFDQIPSP